jgi:fibronectin type 3 domain-containing protein
LESDRTSPLVGQTPSAALTQFDTIAPSPVEGFTVAPEPDARGQYRLSWKPSSATDIRYYNIYFSASEQPQISQKRLIASALKSMTSYLDWSAPLEGKAHYAITAVDRQGNESAPTYSP